jgi:hypothetical protein
MLRRTFALTLLSFGLLLVGGVLTANAEERRDAAGTTGAVAKGHTYWGRIVSTNDARHEIVFRGMMSHDRAGDQTTPGATGRTALPNTGREPAGTQNRNSTGTAGRTAAPERPVTGRSTADRTTGSAAQEKMFTFNLDKNAQITLEGRSCRLADLREGYWARVHALGHADQSQTGTRQRPGTDKSGNVNRGQTANDRGTSAKNHAMMADRVAAFTKAPATLPGTGTGQGTGTGLDRNRTGRTGSQR